MSIESLSERAEHAQRVVNELPVPPREQQRNLDPHVPVVARVEWEHDGVETRETTAYAWPPLRVLRWCYHIPLASR